MKNFTHTLFLLVGLGLTAGLGAPCADGRLGLRMSKDSSATGSVVLEVSNIRNPIGTLLIAVYNRSAAYPDQAEQAVLRYRKAVNQKTVTVELPPLQYGEYAIAFLHDENQNGRMDYNFLGIPVEGYGASNNATKFFRPPRYEEARFKLRQNRQRQQLRLRYWL